MKLFRFCLLGFMLFSLAGCFQVSTVVRVNPDGSGSVEERVLFSRKLLAQFDGLFQGLAPEGGEQPKPMELFEPDKLKLAAQGMGDGVSYRSGRKIVTDEYEGYQVVYAFTDINKLKLQQKTRPAMGGAEGKSRRPRHSASTSARGGTAGRRLSPFGRRRARQRQGQRLPLPRRRSPPRAATPQTPS